jgi:iron complex outermembrane receptor protein
MKGRHQTAFVAVFGTRGRVTGTDLNAILQAAIDRVEILRDVLIISSDAIAGVINIGKKCKAIHG